MSQDGRGSLTCPVSSWRLREPEHAGTGGRPPAREPGISGMTYARDFFFLAEGDRRENNGGDNNVSNKEKRTSVHIYSIWLCAG